MRRCAECSSTLTEESRFCPACGASVVGDHPDSRDGSGSDDGIDIDAMRRELAQSLAPRYEVRELLGRGAMGLVFQARETELRRLVAVKVLSPVLAADARARQRFSREARAAAAVSNAFVVPVYGVGETTGSGLPYIVMQFVNGPTLATWMAGHPRPPEATARRLIGEIARALAAAHSRGLVHRDVKPSNVLLDEESGRALVADFGVAAVLPASPDAADTQQLTARGQIFGTYAYMSPEQITGGTPGPASDVYSLGVLAHELLSGEPPLDAPTPMAWAAAHLRDRPAPLAGRRADLSPECTEILDRCLAKQPLDRPTATEIGDCLLAPMDAETPWPPQALKPLRLSGKALRLLSLTLVGGGILAAGALAVTPDALSIEGPWWQRFADTRGVAGSTLGASVETRPSLDVGVSPWASVLTIGTVVFVLSGMMGSAIAVRTAWMIAAARRKGWGGDTIANALADPDGRSGLVLRGERELAALPASRRLSVLKARRLTTQATLAAAAWLVVSTSIWSLAVYLGVARLTGVGPPMPWPALMLIVLPAAAMLAMEMIAIVRESLLLRPLARRRTHVPSRGGLEGQGRPADWATMDAEPPASFATTSGSEQGASARQGGPAWPVALTALAIFAVVGTLAFASIAVSVGMTARLILDRGPVTARMDADIDRASAASPVREADSVWRYALPREAQASAPPDSVTHWLRQLEAESAPPYPRPPLAVVRPDEGGSRALEGVAASLRRVSVGELPEGATRAVAELDRHPRTLLLRKLAGVRDADLAAAFPDLEAMGSAQAGRPIHVSLREAAEANALVAALAAARGERGTAVRRFGENAAVAARMLAAPTLFANQYGAGMLQDLALMPLADLETLAGNVGGANRLRAVSAGLREHLYPGFLPRDLAGLAADPRDAERLARFERDPNIAPGNRAAAEQAMRLGHCFNVREVLSGPSVDRRATQNASRPGSSPIARARDCEALRE